MCGCTAWPMRYFQYVLIISLVIIVKMLIMMPLVSAAIESSDFTNDFTSLSDVFSSCTILLEDLSVSLAGKSAFLKAVQQNPQVKREIA